MLFKYLHIKPRDWLPSQNYWNYLPQEHLDLKNLYSNSFLLKLNNLCRASHSFHPLLFVWVLLLGVMERPLCVGSTFPVNYDKILYYCSFPPQFLIGLFYEGAFMRETLAQWEYFCHCSRTGPCNVLHLGHVQPGGSNFCLHSCRAGRLVTQDELTPQLPSVPTTPAEQSAEKP